MLSMEQNNVNLIPIAPPLPAVIPVVNFDPKIVQELLDACRFGQAEKVRCIQIT